jgi:hypothetical protein
MKRFGKKIALFSIVIQTITNLAGYVLAIFLIGDSMYMEIIQKVAPAQVAPVFIVGMIALVAMGLYTRFIIWSAKDFVVPMMNKRNRH